MLNTKIITLAAVAITLVGCASVPLENKETSDLAKEFNTPTDNTAGIYIYRKGILGAALKKDIYIDGECIGESAPDTFFYKSVNGPGKYTVSTESEFSPNNLEVYVQAGKNYFIQQFMKIGLFVGGAGLELVDEEKGKNTVAQLDLAKAGNCSQ